MKIKYLTGLSSDPTLRKDNFLRKEENLLIGFFFNMSTKKTSIKQKFIEKTIFHFA